MTMATADESIESLPRGYAYSFGENSTEISLP